MGAWPRLPTAVPSLSRRGPLGDGICQRSPLLSPPPPAGPDSAGGGRGAGAARPSAVRRVWRGGRGRRRERHTKKAAASGAAGKGRQFRDGYSRPRPLVPPPPPPPPVRGRGDNTAALHPRARAPPSRRLPDGAGLAQPPLHPLPARRLPARGSGAPSLALAAGEGSRGPRPPSPATCEPGKVCGGVFAGRPRPPAHAVPAGDSVGSASGCADRGDCGGEAGARAAGAGARALRPGLRLWRVAIEEGQKRKTMPEEVCTIHGKTFPVNFYSPWPVS
ncbi:WAS/WASL-interacting protein family member 1-like [Pipistrellus kuhlii]|uniref:WAS/WASL-interacting protein family member 1-like n=1 Tax=Pipistrellus kuhlii TaxID=59472 RepID=UPI001E274AC5|nr:WAS/WASL-interacting protein family member 1-like [Pipistrellus kuhlii]